MKIVKKGSRIFTSAKQLMAYKKKIKAWTKSMRREVERRVLALFEAPVGEEYREIQKGLLTLDESISSQSRILLNSLIKKYKKLFSTRSKEASEIMVRGILSDTKKNLNRSLKQAEKDITVNSGLIPSYLPENVKETSKAIVLENIGLIKSIPEEYLNDISGDVMRGIIGGGNLQEIKRALLKHGQITERRADIIAEDQVRKATNAVAAERMKSSGIEVFEWIHSGGGKTPRKYHQERNGKFYRFDDLPINPQTGEREIPGQAPNCRCTMRPIYEFEPEFSKAEKNDGKN